MDIVSIIRDKLMMTQKKMFWMTYFGHLLELEDIQFNIVFIHLELFYIINRKDPVRELWFRINDVDVMFSLVKFALMTGLMFEHDTKVSNYIDFLKTL